MMDKKVKEQILAVRNEGTANMFDINAVLRVAYEQEYYELVEWLQENRRAYIQYILTGEDL